MLAPGAETRRFSVQACPPALIAEAGGRRRSSARKRHDPLTCAQRNLGSRGVTVALGQYRNSSEAASRQQRGSISAAPRCPWQRPTGANA